MSWVLNEQAFSKSVGGSTTFLPSEVYHEVQQEIAGNLSSESVCKGGRGGGGKREKVTWRTAGKALRAMLRSSSFISFFMFSLLAFLSQAGHL